MRGELHGRLLLLAVLGITGASCSVIFSPDDLSSGNGRGTTGQVATGGSASTSTSTSAGGGGSAGGSVGSTGGGVCQIDADCNDGDDCTADACGQNHLCAHVVALDAPCGTATDCTPRGTCNADGACVPGAPNPAACDDHQPCTNDHCDADGCHHDALADGTACDDGNDCDQSSCVGGVCSGQPFGDFIGGCAGDGLNCPAGTYRETFFCNGLDCGGQAACDSFCVNSYKCRRQCGATFDACCVLGDPTHGCDNACGSSSGPYQPQAMLMKDCGCGNAPAVRCAKTN